MTFCETIILVLMYGEKNFHSMTRLRERQLKECHRQFMAGHDRYEP